MHGIIILAALTVCICTVTITNVIKHMKNKSVSDVKKMASKEQDYFYDNFEGVLISDYRFCIINDSITTYTQYRSRLTLCEIYKNDEKIILKIHHEYNDKDIVLDFSSPIVKDFSTTNNTASFSIRIVICKASIFSTIIDREDYDDCIFVVCDRYQSFMSVFKKESGSITGRVDIQNLKYIAANELNLFHIICSTEDTDLKYGKIYPLSYVGTQKDFSERVKNVFCTLTNYKTNYIHKYDY